MYSLASASSLQELKKEYRKLAAVNHPDRGGNPARMQKINAEYKVMRDCFKKAKNDSHHQPLNERDFTQSSQQSSQHSSRHDTRHSSHQSSDDFSRISNGDTVYVNGTECEVTYVNERFFRVVAKGRSRQALINKETGQGKLNVRLYASHRNNGRRYQH